MTDLNMFRTEINEGSTKTWQTVLLSVLGAGISLYKYYPELFDELQKKIVNWINCDKKDANNNNFMLILIILGVVMYFNNLSQENNAGSPVKPNLDGNITPQVPEADKTPEGMLPPEQPEFLPIFSV
ncbi:hypothetical protein AN640_08650 [Candidatus Epulonipiscium fishelsonii]|uniref:Uncharacterized protein n=1 Tax=Candidatus Epulonipiscium fishelsonii TaxID=77094 RepID=A0ACC8XCS4_9FIRM|nr:hypothetical protein AN640_08650 [Epulopiscium sp. SCG-D08WGA-EpuloA1]OON96314.1 MAG: hypothetical protein ATN32_06490 [Epulopiscium sp. AS2M-Bin002]